MKKFFLAALFLAVAVPAFAQTVELPRLSLQRFGASLGVDHRWQTQVVGEDREQWLARIGASYKLGKSLSAVATGRLPFDDPEKPEWAVGLSLVIVRDGRLVSP